MPEGRRCSPRSPHGCAGGCAAAVPAELAERAVRKEIGYSWPKTDLKGRRGAKWRRAGSAISARTVAYDSERKALPSVSTLAANSSAVTLSFWNFSHSGRQILSRSSAFLGLKE